MKDIVLALLGGLALLEMSFLSEVIDTFLALPTICMILIILFIILIIIVAIIKSLIRTTIRAYFWKKFLSSSEKQTTGDQPSQQQQRQSPPPSQKPSKNCPDCGGQMRYIEEYNRWYCDSCQEYK
ncbi:MAG: hypothetical protein KGY66_08565 [Candidatus Thermoplasmatota archaeon]|nr:hypothetical protein [Candidatus Thermoplasmatota archaeon]MBS3790947.1 hypothetical protein [Candidatus Thermoplasmatota archaeon]